MSKILLGVTGCIAAYKACEIVRELQRKDASLDVKVVMSEHATQFIGPTTFRALTKNKVAVSLFDAPDDPIFHISLAREADVLCIAPATANVIAKLAHGIADDLLSTTALACTAPFVVAPAMNTGMWQAQATQENIATLKRRGVSIVGPDSGYLACGQSGKGRLAKPEIVVEAVFDALSRTRELAGKNVLVSAGPTQEALDPVRYISNGSSGKMGYAIAAEALARGAQVTLVTGPTALETPAGADVVRVRSAVEMLEACRAPFNEADIAVFVAAVSDWRPEQVADTKIKHDEDALDLHLVKNPDIAATLCRNKGKTRAVIFAAETGDPRASAKRKLVAKHADLVVANDLSEPKCGMGSDDNHVWLIDAIGETELARAPKRKIARAILDKICA